MFLQFATRQHLASLQVSDWFVSVVDGFKAVSAYTIELFADVGVLLLSASIDPMINDLLHYEVLRDGFVFRFRISSVVVPLYNLFFILFGLYIDGGLSGVRLRFFF